MAELTTCLCERHAELFGDHYELTATRRDCVCHLCGLEGQEYTYRKKRPLRKFVTAQSGRHARYTEPWRDF